MRALMMRTGISDVALADYEADRSSPQLDRAAVIADAIGVAVDWLAFDGVPPGYTVGRLEPWPLWLRDLTPEGLAYRLRGAREARRLRVEDVERFAGVVQKQLTLYENAELLPRVATVQRIAAGLKICPGWLGYWIGKPIGMLGVSSIAS